MARVIVFVSKVILYSMAYDAADVMDYDNLATALSVYGLKSVGAAFITHLARWMGFLGYESCEADLDLWLKPEIKSGDVV